MTNHVLTPGPAQLTLAGAPPQAQIQMYVTPDLAFVLGRPFYELVVTYLIASAGLTPVFDAMHYPDFMRDVSTGADIWGSFPGRVVNAAANVNLRHRVDQVRSGGINSERAERALLCMLANSAYEEMTDAQRRKLTGKPTYEVFRHVRNAASHGNRWDFVANKRVQEPRNPAFWRGFVIDHNAKGAANPLHQTQCFGTSLLAADLLYLLGDVEKMLP